MTETVPDPQAEGEVSASKLLPDSEIRHISGRVVYAMEWTNMLRSNPLGMTPAQHNNARMAIFKSAADVPLLLGEVGILRGLVNESAGYLIDIVKDPKSDPEAKIVALTALGLLQIEVGGKDEDVPA